MTEKVPADNRVPQPTAERKGPLRVHVVCGDVMVVTNRMVFDHDVQYANRKILQWMDEYPERKLVGTVASDYSKLDRWLQHAHILISYCSGPVADDPNTEVLQRWLEAGGKMIGIHGTSGGYARRVKEEDFASALYEGEIHSNGNGPKQWVKKRFHDTLGAFFMAHAPIHTFPVQVADPDHPLNANIPSEFSLEDELYLFELQGDLADYKILLTTEYDIMGVDMVRSNYAYTRGYPWDPARKIEALQALYTDNALPKQSEMLVDRDPGERNAAHPALGSSNKRVMAYERKVGDGAVCYMGLGHCSVNLPGRPGYKGPWANPTFEQLVKNAIAWAAS